MLKALDVTAEELLGSPDLAQQLATGEVDLALVRGVFSAGTMEAVLERLHRGDHGLTVLPQQHPDPKVEQVTLYGDAITPCNNEKKGPPPDRYHASARSFREACRRLFEGHPDYELRLREVLGRVSGGRAVEVPRDATGRIYTPSTIRKVPPRRDINVHVHQYEGTTAVYAHLCTQLAPLDQLSFFIPLSTPESGGALEVFDLVHQDPRTPRFPSGEVDDAAVRAGFPVERFSPGAGDMCLFNGGRYYHRVDHVQGSRPRWTIGGFASLSRDDRVLHYWG